MIGASVVQCLVGRGYEVSALARSAASAGRLRDMGAQPLSGDIRDPEQWLGEAVERVDAVVHAAATFTDDMGVVDQALVEALLPRLRASGRSPTLLYTGGCWLYGGTGGRLVDEQATFDPPAAFAWMAEQVRTVLAAPGIRGIVVHPALLWGGGGGVLAGFADDARRLGRVRVVGGETIRWPLVHREDLAVLYALALERGRPGAAYNGASMPGVPVGEIARGIARRFGCGDEAPLVRPVEEIVVELGEWARGYALDQRMSSEKARRDLSWEPTRVDIFGVL
jgi:nucleoside-diphosphate-sugar epimerase